MALNKNVIPKLKHKMVTHNFSEHSSTKNWGKSKINQYYLSFNMQDIYFITPK